MKQQATWTKLSTIGAQLLNKETINKEFKN